MRPISSVVLLGTRGTVSRCESEYSRYGGATACVLVKLGGEAVVLDAGSGILGLERHLPAEGHKISLLISHPHTDHMVGLPCSPLLQNRDMTIDFYARERGGQNARELFGLLMRPPLWPVAPEALPAQLSFHDVEGDFSIGDVAVSVMEGCHPGGCTVYRLSGGGKSVVYATDFEHGEATARLEKFARGCSLLIYDAQFDEKEYASRRGWGHSTWQEGLRLAERTGAKRLILTHHAPYRTDAELDAFTKRIGKTPVACAFGRCGEEIEL